MNISAAERSDAMKTYRPTAELLEDIRDVFAMDNIAQIATLIDDILALRQFSSHLSPAPSKDLAEFEI